MRYLGEDIIALLLEKMVPKLFHTEHTSFNLVGFEVFVEGGYSVISEMNELVVDVLCVVV